MRRHLHSRTSRLLTLLSAAIAAFVLACAFCSSPAPLTEPKETPAARTRQTAQATAVPAILPPRVYRSARCYVPVVSAGGGWDPPADYAYPSPEERRRTRRLIDLIAREMGADRNARRLLVRWAVRESFSDPARVHVKPGDVKAASSPRSRRLVSELGQEWGPEWSYGRGLYGMQPALYVPVWDRSADPDVLCDPIVATVTAIWSARRQQRQCTRQGYPPTLLTANRRWGSGHCEPREQDEITRAWWADRGRDADAPVSWGRRWREDRTSRAEVYEHMREKAHAAGLL